MVAYRIKLSKLLVFAIVSEFLYLLTLDDKTSFFHLSTKLIRLLQTDLTALNKEQEIL